MEENILLMPFKDESESFTNGFECGQIWELCKQGFEFKDYLIHTENDWQIRKILNQFNYVNYKIFQLEDTWSTLTTKPTKIEDFIKT